MHISLCATQQFIAANYNAGSLNLAALRHLLPFGGWFMQIV